jgi:Tfp pilus assembly protein PilO
MEALDTLLWCFARAEVQSAAEIRTQFAEMREFVSTLLRKIAEEKEFVELSEEIGDDVNE